MFDELLRGWDGDEVVIRFDAATGSWMLIGVHSTRRGPAMGGTRMKAYATPEDALADVLRLSRAMTFKQAAANLPYGGGKAVLAVPAVPERGSPERRDLLLAYAALVDSLHGTYVTAADMNTGPPDMDVIGERTPHVLGRSHERGGSGDPGGGTAIGVFHGIRATCLRAFGSPDLDGRSILVQGAGSVGGRLLDLLHAEDARLLVSDVDGARAQEAATRVDAKLVDPADAIGTEVDVFAPCATGPVLTPETIPMLACRAVAGAANNQLETEADAAPARRARHPLRARLRDQRRRRDPPGGLRDPRLGRGDDGGAPGRDRRDARRCVRGGRSRRHHDGRGRRPARPRPAGALSATTARGV